MFNEVRYRLEDITLASVETGVKKFDGTTILFLHGWLDNSASFFTLIEQLKPQIPDAHLVAVDLPGHGLSTHRRSGNYSAFHDYIDDIHQLVTKLSPNRLVIVGHSLGALIASCYSAAFPEKVDGLVEIEGFGALTEPAENAVSRLRQGVISRKRQRAKPSRRFNSLEEMIERRAAINGLSNTQIAPILERGSVQEEGMWHWRFDSRLTCDSLYRMSPEHAKAILDAIDCPHQVIIGDSGYSAVKEAIENYSGSSFGVTQIEGGHHCHLQHPELTSGLIVDLVNKI